MTCGSCGDHVRRGEEYRDIYGGILCEDCYREWYEDEDEWDPTP